MDFDYRLLAKYLTGMLSPEEMKQVEEWRELSIDNEEVFSELMKLRVSWKFTQYNTPCLLYTSPSPRDATLSRMPSSA